MALQEDILKLKAEIAKIEEQINKEYVDVTGNCSPIIDGIIHVESYLDAKLKILWILKEPYDEIEDSRPSGGGWSFSKEFLAKDNMAKGYGRSSNTWFPIIYVSYGILNSFKYDEEIEYIHNDESIADVIKSIAIINVKKLPGLTRVIDPSSIANSYREHKDLLHYQIKTYNPDIIIGGNTLHYFYEDLGIEVNIDIKQNGSLEYAEKDSRLYISAYHPANFTLKREIYIDEIIEVAENWYNEKRKTNS